MAIAIDQSTRTDLSSEEKRVNRFILAIWLAEVLEAMGRPSYEIVADTGDDHATGSQ